MTSLASAYRDVTDHLQLLLRKSGHHLHTTAEREVVRTIKEKCCYVALNPAKEEKDTQSRFEDLKLPDGKVIQVSAYHIYELQTTDSAIASLVLRGSVHLKFYSIQNS